MTICMIDETRNMWGFSEFVNELLGLDEDYRSNHKPVCIQTAG